MLEIKQNHIYYDINSQDVIKCLESYSDNTAKVIKAYIKVDENDNGIDIIPHPDYSSYLVSKNDLTDDLISKQRFHKQRLYRITKALEVLVLKKLNKELKLKNKNTLQQ